MAAGTFPCLGKQGRVCKGGDQGRELACLGDREPGELHQLIDGKGAGAHELLVERGGGFRRESLRRVLVRSRP